MSLTSSHAQRLAPGLTHPVLLVYVFIMFIYNFIVLPFQQVLFRGSSTVPAMASSSGRLFRANRQFNHVCSKSIKTYYV